MTATDAIEFIMAGATAIEIGTANFIDPSVSGKIVDGINQWLDDHNIENINDIGAPLPPFLMKIAANIKSQTEDKTDISGKGDK